MILVRESSRLIILGAILAAALLLGSPAPSDAAEIVLVSNTGQHAYGGTPVGAYDHAQGFTTGKNTLGYVLTSIELQVHTAPANGTLTVSVREADGQDPSDTVLYTLTNPGNLGTGLRKFTAPANSTLNAEITYFVHMTFAVGGNPTQPQWGLTDRTTEDSGAYDGWSIANVRHSRPTGSSVDWSNGTDARIKIKVKGENRAPAAPVNLSATVGNGQVTLSWNDPDNDTITKYQYNTDGGETFNDIAGSGATTTTYTVTGLTNGTQYTFAVRAVNDGGDGAASTVDVLMVPAAPANLMATPDDGQVVLSWDDPGNTTITKYQYSTGGGTNFTDIALNVIDSSETGKLKHTVTDLTNGATHTLAVRAVNVSGEGPASTVEALMVPAAPAGLSAMPGDGRVALRWTNPGNATITKYQYSTDGGTIFDDIGGSDAVTITYTVTVLSDGTNTNLTNYTEYAFAVRAVNISGTGPATTVDATPAPVPDSPEGLSAMPGDGRVALSWTNPNNDTITEYDVSSDGGANYTSVPSGSSDLVQDNDENTITYTVTGLTNGATHTLAVRAVNASGEGPASTVDALMVPAAPAGLSAMPGDGRVPLSWTNPNNDTITGYDVSSVSSDGGTNYALVAYGSSDLVYDSDENTIGYTVTGLTNYQEYEFRIRAVNETGAGPASNSASSTPRIGKPAKPTDLSAQAGDSKVIVQWDDPVNDTITGYQISEVVPEDFLTATDSEPGDQVGISVAVDGNTAVVGAFREDANDDDDAIADLVDSGSAYVFTPNSAGEWIQRAKLTASDGAAGDQFGWSVAVEGDTIVVGAYRDEDVGDDVGDDKGSAYVFVKPDTGWTSLVSLSETAKLTAPDRSQSTDGGKHDLFGVSVAVDVAENGSETVVVGAPFQDYERDAALGDLIFVGAVYVFTKPDTDANGDGSKDWKDWDTLDTNAKTDLTAKLTTPTTPVNTRLPNDLFGFSVAVDGDTLLTSAHSSDDGFNRNGHGRAYLFTKPDGGWVNSSDYTTKLTASDGAPGDWFGYSVALDGDTAVIGARLHNDPDAGAGTGAAYVLTRESGVWGEKAKLAPSDGAAQDNFGYSVAVDGDNVVVGAWLDDDHGSRSGSAYVFTKPARGWAASNETLKLTHPAGAAGDRFGSSVAVEGKQALVGAYSDDHDVGDDGSIEINAGSVHVLGIPDWRDITGSGKSTVSHIEQGLTNGDEYTFQIRALNQSGAGPASDAASATPLGVPAAPALTAATGDTQVTLSWTKHVPTDPITIAPITRYEYSIDDGSTFIEIALSDINDSDATNLAYTVTGLDNLTTYTFQILAVNAIGETASKTHYATPASATPDAPANLLANPGDTQVRLTWEDPGDSSIDKYQYRWKEGTQVTLFDAQDEWRDVPNSNANTTRYTVTGLSNGTSYAFQVRAWDDGAETKGSEPAQISAEPFSATPAAPTGLMADPDDSLVALTWDDPDDSTIDRYEYRQKVEDPSNPNEFGDWMPITSSGPTTTEYTVTDLVNGTEYTFEVRAVDVHNGTEDEGDPSADRATPLPPVPGKPTILSVAERNQEVTLSWQAPPGSVVETYEVLHLQASALVNPGVVVDDKFGYSVAVDGDIAVVGAYRDDNNGADSGAAYVFTRSGGVEWDQGVKLTASDGAAYDNFGISVAVDGDTLVVGAPGDDDNGADSGSVYVFTRDPDSGEWRQGAKLTPDDGQALDYFGYSVAVSGDTVLVGAYQDDEDNDLEDSGSAYVFVKPNSEGGWDDWDDLPQTNDDDEVEDQDDLTAKLTASDAADDAYFGTSVALDGDTAVIGAPGDDDDGIDSGSVYVFVRPSGGWAGWGTLSATEKLGLTTKLTAGADGGAGDALGISVALDVETVLEDSVEVEVTTVVVGAYLDDREDDATTEVDETAIDAGSAYVFTNSAVMWDDGVKLPPSDGEAGDYFGYSVAVDVDTVVVGAYGDDENGSESGSAYVFTRDPSDASWVQANKLYAENGEAGGRFGYGVAVDAASNTALVGAGSAHVLDIHDWEEVEGGSGARSHTFAMLTNEREYDFQVRAVNLAGAGDEAKAEVELQGPGGGGGSAVRPERDKAPVNNAPRFTEGDVTSRTVPEDSEIGTAVGSPLSATDSDGDPLRYSLFGDGQTYFQVDPATGQLMTTASLDYEAQSEYSVQVTVNDDNGGRDVINLTIAVLDVDEPPSQPGAPQVSSAGLNGLNVSWTAPDNQGPEITDYDVRYREAGGEFQDAGHDGTGTSATLNDLSPESGYEVQVRAVNAEGTSPWSESGQGETEGALPAPVPTATPTPTQTPVPSTTPTPVPTPDAGATGATPVPTPDAGATGATPVPTPVQTQVPLTAITKLSRTALAFRPPTLTPSPATAPTVPPRPTPPSLAMLSPTVGPTPAPPPAAPLTAPADEGGFSFNFNLWWILLILLLVVVMILTARLYTVMRRR